MSFEKSKHSIRLDDLNKEVRERVQKFDTGNDGELDINEAVQGLITLQKQSNNYKKMIWLLIPVLCLVLAGSFGTTILAINLTKDIHQNSGILTSKVDNTPIRTVEATSKDLMFSSLFSTDYNQITKLHFGTLTLNVNGIYQYTDQDHTKNVYVNSDMVFFGVNQTGSFMVQYRQGYEHNPMAQMMYQIVNDSFSEVSLIIDYYRSTYGVQPTFDHIQQYTFMYTVTTSKVPEEYSISYDKTIMSSNMVSSTSRVASEESTGYSECQGSLMYLRACKENDCWECTYINERSGSRERMCVLLVKSYHVDCVKVN
jgi:VCBS repeat-containing protein